MPDSNGATQVDATPDQLEFYGFFPWIIIQRITLPICAFFRSIIFKNAFLMVLKYHCVL